MFYDREGRPISPEEWRELWASDPNYRGVALTRVGEVAVATLWLGIDHNFDHGPPLIFETEILGGPLDGEVRHYITEEGARAGHEETVRLVLAEVEMGP